MWRVRSLQEADYGCEERMPGEPVMTLVTLESDDYRVMQFEMPDNWLIANEIDEGDEWPEDIDGVDELAQKVDRQSQYMDGYLKSIAEMDE